MKTRDTCCKLVSLHREFNQQDQVIQCYHKILSTYDQGCEGFSESDANNLSKAWLEFGIYLVSRDEILEKDWLKVCRCGQYVLMNNVSLTLDLSNCMYISMQIYSVVLRWFTV